MNTLRKTFTINFENYRARQKIKNLTDPLPEAQQSNTNNLIVLDVNGVIVQENAQNKVCKRRCSCQDCEK